MPGQYTNYHYTRSIMVLLRCLWATFYLWAMMHAAAILPIPLERWEANFWSKKLKYILTYKSMFEYKMKNEMYIYVMVLVLLYSLFRCCRCSFVGVRYFTAEVDKPLGYRLLIFKTPYCVSFLYCWAFSIASTTCAIFDVAQLDESGKTHIVFCQLVTALIFKLLVLANAFSVTLRIWGYLKIFEAESAENQLIYHNFGDHLNLFFRV
ncbi:uncharacterized protein [Drosophila takahashii]|uniref:uncharacterized protein n=1 Tax=Drosophila takahashii TaxID=29030 RepID=UPI001CF8468A|nr:uncharacterized protein LOC108060696 [Drosophila takahashii]